MATNNDPKQKQPGEKEAGKYHWSHPKPLRAAGSETL